MKCSQCGAELNEHSASCPACSKEAPVTVLTRAERDNFKGETIETAVVGKTEDRRNNYYSYQSSPNYNKRVYKFNWVPTTFWGKAAAILVVGLFFLVAMPLFFAALLVGIVLSMFFFKKR
jgi:UDP-N-acetylglucosamine:LPS N-acetylglucosamine transferase